MSRFILVSLFLCLSIIGVGQSVKSGTYTFSLKDAEYQNHPKVAMCKVIIHGKRIKVIYTSGNLTNIKIGNVYDEGILLWHKGTKQWIIGHSRRDANAVEVGGCSDGPRVIDFKKRVIWHC